MRPSVIAAAVLLASCSGPREGGEDIDYAAINEAAEGPGVPITPDPITFEDLEKHDLFGAGCYVMHADGENLIFLANDAAAHFILGGDLVTLAPHPGSRDLPYGVSTHYDGRAHSAELAIDAQSEALEGTEVANYDGSLTIRDEKERVVFDYSGKVECGA